MNLLRSSQSLLVLNCVALRLLFLLLTAGPEFSGYSHLPQDQPVLRANGGRGRIRTSVARKERQISSLLVLATHPPVRTGSRHRDRTRNLQPQRYTRSPALFTQETRCPFIIGDPPPPNT